MADITFTGFVEKVLISGAGAQYGFTVAEPHRKKQDDGSYTTTARTFHTVKGNAASGFQKGDRVTITGRQITEPWSRDGETRYSLVVWADTVTPAQSAVLRSGSTEHPTDESAFSDRDPGEPSWVVAEIGNGHTR
jgi:single-stranded DNA-binding protein